LSGNALYFIEKTVFSLNFHHPFRKGTKMSEPGGCIIPDPKDVKPTWRNLLRAILYCLWIFTALCVGSVIVAILSEIIGKLLFGMKETTFFQGLISLILSCVTIYSVLFIGTFISFIKKLIKKLITRK